MKLTIEEFKQIRTLPWAPTLVKEKKAYILTDETSCSLFWYDFIKLNQEKLTKQKIVTNIANFDQTQSVLLYADGTLYLPPEIELAIFSGQYSEPFLFKIPIKTSILIVLYTIITICLISITIVYKNKNFLSIY